MRAVLDKKGDIKVSASKSDICRKCKNVLVCPLIQAVQQELVILHYEETLVAECGLFKK